MPGALDRVVRALSGADADGGRPDRALPRVAAIVAEEAAGPCAVYAADPAGPGLACRALAGAGGRAHGDCPPVGPERTPVVMRRLGEGEPVDGSLPEGARLLEALGLAGGQVVPVRSAGSLVGAVAAPAAPWLAPVADVLGLALGAGRLAVRLHERAEALDRRVRRLDALAEVAHRVARAVDEGDVAGVVAREARALVRADAAILFARDGVGRPRPVAGDGWTVADPVPAVVDLAAEGPEPVWLGRELAVAVGGDGTGRPEGLLVALRRGGSPFGEDDIARLSGLAREAAVALDNARLVGRLRRERAERDRLAAALVDAQEEERRRVAEDIHDGPVQELVGVSLLLDALAGDLRAQDRGGQREAEHAAASARDALRALRRAIFDLHPMVLDELGFAAAVRTLAQRLEWQGVQVDVDADEAEALAPALRTVAFRTCQEAIANVLRHAEATHVRVSARAGGGLVVVEVRDDGRGFDVDATPGGGIEEGHIGLRALRERAALVGGAVEVRSGDGGGTVVRLSLPAEAPA